MDELLCNHISRLYSGKCQQRVINSFVAMMVTKYHSGTFVDACKSLSQGLKRFSSGDPEGFHVASQHFRMKKYWWQGANSIGPKAQAIMIPNSKFIEEALDYCSHHPQEANKLLSGLMKLHTALETDRKPSQSAITRVRETITSPGPDIEGSIMYDMLDHCDRFAQYWVRRYGVPEREYMTLARMPANKNKYSYSLLGAKSVPRDRSELYHLGALLDHELVRPIAETYPSDMFHAVISAGAADGFFNTENRPIHGGPIGSISMIPERANKYRTVAVPSIGILSMSYPLSRILHQGIRRVKTQGVKSHDDTTRYLSTLIDGNRTFHSMDMSNFTDRFPYEIQRVLLEAMELHGLVLPYDLAVQDIVCYGSYDFRQGPIRYEVGTPQGTYPSFPLASLSHGIIAAISYERAHGTEINLFKDDLPFRVIGDDIVLYDDPTYQEFTSIMESLGVEVSKEKTLNSKTHIEMCSKWISHREVNQQKKIKPIESEGAYQKAYFYYGSGLEEIPEFQYLHHLPVPFGVLEEDMDDVVVRISDFSSKLNALSTKMTLKDYSILSNRHQYTDLYTITDRHGDLQGNVRDFTPLEASILKDGKLILGQLEELESEEDISRILEDTEDVINHVSEIYSQMRDQVRSGPGVPDTTDWKGNKPLSGRERAKSIGLQRLQAPKPYSKGRDDDEKGGIHSFTL